MHPQQTKKNSDVRELEGTTNAPRNINAEDKKESLKGSRREETGGEEGRRRESRREEGLGPGQGWDQGKYCQGQESRRKER